MEKEIVINKGIVLNMDSVKFSFLNSEASNTDIMKYLKLKYHSYEILCRDLLNPVINVLEKDSKIVFEKSCEEIKEIYNDIIPFSYKEAFELKNDNFKAFVFGTIGVGEMIENLGHTTYKVDGITLTQKKYSPNGDFIEEYEHSNIFEVHKINGEKLGIKEAIYAVKCWCTTTDKEHWLWIEEKYKDDPLEAIASTFRVHESIIPYIRAIKRQGDILLCELEKEVTPDKNDNIVPLSKEQYFGFLKAQA